MAKPSDETLLQLPLANIDIGRAADGAVSMRTEFVVPAIDVSSVDIDVPDGQQLVQVLVDGHPAVLTWLEDRPKLNLPEPTLPHFVEVVTHCRQPAQPASVETPQLRVGSRPCVVEYRLWSVRQPRRDGQVVSTAAETLPSVEVAALRLNQLLAASSSDGRSDDSPPISWAARWTAELTAAEQALRNALTEVPIGSPDIVDAMPAAEEYAELLARATAETTRKRDAAVVDTEQTADTTELGDRESVAMSADEVLVQSSPGPLEWSTVVPGSSDRAIRWLLAVATGVLATLFVATRDWQTTIEWNYSLCFPFVVMAGLLWWFCLWPRAVGLLLAVAAVVAWLRWIRIAGDRS